MTIKRTKTFSTREWLGMGFVNGKKTPPVSLSRDWRTPKCGAGKQEQKEKLLLAEKEKNF